ncbi:MAG: hypothetical protein JXR76_22230 [Deltaproteobacteria bacterium]|nr:hypothetical protein [Deltaproteobacteria bacterium]
MKDGLGNTVSDDYSMLLDELSVMYAPVAQMGVEARNRLMVKVFWGIGHRIVDVLQTAAGERSARYGEGVVDKLIRDLTARYGKGFGRSNLFYMRQFALEVPKSEISRALSWTHYRILFGLKDLDTRAALAKRVIAEELDCDALRAVVKLALGDNGADMTSMKNGFYLAPGAGKTGLVKLERDGFGAPGWVVNPGFNIRRCRLEKVGRYVGDVYYGKDWVWLNQELAEKGKAKFLDMRVGAR